MGTRSFGSTARAAGPLALVVMLVLAVYLALWPDTVAPAVVGRNLAPGVAHALEPGAYITIGMVRIAAATVALFAAMILAAWKRGFVTRVLFAAVGIGTLVMVVVQWAETVPFKMGLVFTILTVALAGLGWLALTQPAAEEASPGTGA